MKIIIATNNMHKVKEISQILGKTTEILTLRDISFNQEIIEDGNLFFENAMIKCRAVYDSCSMPVLADDSGLCVAQLNGAPGIISARYGREDMSDQERYLYLLEQLDPKGNLDASFVCSLILYMNPNRFFVIQEEVQGKITFNPKGQNGFGYDPVFFVPHLNKTVAELSDAQKNQISHRGKSVRLMKKIMEDIEK